MGSPYSSVEIKVGIFLAFSLALFVGMIVNFGKFGAALGRERLEIRVVFADAGTVKTDAPVRYNGLEVGRVKWMRMLHMDDDAIERLPPLAKRDLDNLPLRPESLVRKLRDAGEADFETLVKRTLKNRTMIEICLEVLQDGDMKRYRVDDQVRVVSTVFGDTAVEIISGNGPINTVADNKVLLGLSGDFFSNLAKSMGDVKEILSNVTDVVGTDERRSFERSQSRLPAINEKLDAISTTANKRVTETARRLDKIGEDISKTLNDTSAILETLEPKVNKTSENVKAAFQTMQTNLNETQEEAAKAAKEVNADLEVIRNDVRFAVDQSKPNFEEMKKNVRGVYDVMGGLSSRIDGMRRVGGRLLATSGPELQRAGVALKNGLKYLSQTGQAALENKDLMISMKDVGEYEYNTAVVMYREITAAVRRMRDATSELQATCFKLSELEDDGPRVSQGNFVVGQLNAARAPLERLQSSVEQAMLPEYERKKTAWSDDPTPAK